jgi:hypothetical protein
MIPRIVLALLLSALLVASGGCITVKSKTDKEVSAPVRTVHDGARAS